MSKEDRKKYQDRLAFFGKCCWTCGQDKCFNAYCPPHESNEGTECKNWIEMNFSRKDTRKHATHD